MMASLVTKVLASEELDDKNRDLRDNCLDCIEDHIMDVNAFVRSKVGCCTLYCSVALVCIAIATVRVS